MKFIYDPILVQKNIKNLKNKNSTEKFKGSETTKLDSLIGGEAGSKTFTGENSTREGIFDKDSQKECLCGDKFEN